MKTAQSFNTAKAIIIVLLLNISIIGLAQEEYCCERNFIFPEFPMPAEQERNISGFISGAWNSYVMKAGAHENEACPIKISVLSYSGTIDLEHMVEKISSVTRKKEPKQDTNSDNVKKNADYTWKGQLELTYIEKIVPGTTEPAYEGGTEYVPGYVVGGWKFTIKLYDIQHDEIVKEASTTWTGSDIGFYKNLRNEYNEGESQKLYIDILEELYDREFSDLKQIIIDYEKAPKKAEFESKEIKVNPDEIRNITIKVTDKDGNAPKEWQRLAIKVQFGKLTNGTPCCVFKEDFRIYSFYCGKGNVTIRYKAPEGNKATFDHLTVYNGCATKDESLHPMTYVDEKEVIGEADVVLINDGYSGNITVTKSWDYTKQYDDHSETCIGTQTVTFSGIFKPLPQMEGMEGQPIKMYGAGSVNGTWKHNEQRYCEGGPGCGKCKGLVFEEFGAGSIPAETLKGLIIITNVWPTDNKTVADQLGKFGLENWYDIATPTETVPTQTRSKGGEHCTWSNSTLTTVITGSDVRFKLKDIKNLTGKASWSSSSGTSGISATDMTEAIYEQKPFDPEQDGADYTYTITWNLKAL